MNPVHRFFTALLAAITICVFPAFGQEQAPVAEPRQLLPTSAILSNGMEILLQNIPGADFVSVGIVFRGGADAHTSKTAGLFRLLEYVLFRGLALSPGEPEPAGAIESLDTAVSTGGVREESFGLTFSVAPDKIPQALDTLAYLFSDLRLQTAFSDPSAFEEARQAALVGINQGFSDPQSVFYHALTKKLFVAAPWRTDIAGADYVVNAATEESLRAFAAQWMVPNNAALSVAGDFSTEDVMIAVDKAFSAWKKGSDPWKSPPAVLPKPGVTRPTLVVYPDPSISEGMAEVEMRYRGPDASSPRAAAASLWAEMTSRPEGRLAAAIKKGMPKWSQPTDIGSRYAILRGASWFSVSARLALDPKVSLAEAVLGFKEIVRGTEMYAMKTNTAYFSAREFETAKSALLEDWWAGLEDPARAVSILTENWAKAGTTWIKGWAGRISGVTSKDISAFADEYFMKNLEIVSVRLNPDEYAARKKSFDSYGFELITPQKAFWWK